MAKYQYSTANILFPSEDEINYYKLVAKDRGLSLFKLVREALEAYTRPSVTPEQT